MSCGARCAPLRNTVRLITPSRSRNTALLRSVIAARRITGWLTSRVLREIDRNWRVFAREHVDVVERERHAHVVTAAVDPRCVKAVYAIEQVDRHAEDVAGPRDLRRDPAAVIVDDQLEVV